MYTANQLLDKIEIQIKSLNLDNKPERLYNPIKYIFEDKGKRIRPLLALMSANIFNENIDNIYMPAMALEVFHNFTLLHDDIIDKAPIRRGRPTAHTKWGENIAILSGDAMTIIAYTIMCQNLKGEQLHKTLTIFNKAAIEVCQGQQLDLDFETQYNVTLEEYINMIRLKTSVLLAASAQIGAMLSGANEKQQSQMYKFGENIGLAFQIQDDILDTYGDTETFGKSIGGDIAVGKKTHLYIIAISKANKIQQDILLNSRNYIEVRAVYDGLRVKNKAMKAVEHYYAEALNSLQGCTDDIQKIRPLMDYARKLLKRDR